MVYTAEEANNIKDQQFAYLQVEESDHVLTLTLNRPEKKNAMNPVMVQELAYSLSYAHYNNDVWCVLVGANGDVFCAGADLAAFMAKEPEPNDSTIPPPQTEILIGEMFLQLHKPCIAKVQGPALAGAFLLICGCTHVVAIDSAIFALPEVKRGIWPMQVMQSLLPIMPARKVLDMCMTGRTLSCEEALNLGIVTSMVSSGELNTEVETLIKNISDNSPTAIRQGLKAYDELRNIEMGERHAYLKKMLGEVLKSEDAKEGITAFKEKRKPNWTGK